MSSHRTPVSAHHSPIPTIARSRHDGVRCIGREWLVGLLSYALLIAPFGCQFSTQLTDDSTGATNSTDSGADKPNTSTAGLFLNPTVSDPLIVAGRNAQGDSFFVFGTRTAAGSIEQVDSILVKTAAGQEAVIVFDLGLPTFARGPDGSYVRITYSERSGTRLVATADIHDAAANTTTSYDVTIDATQTARQVAEKIKELTGQTLPVPETSTATQKVQQRELSGILRALAIIPLVFFSQYMIVVMGQVMQEVFAAVAVTMQATVLAAFWPLFAFSGLLGDSLGNILLVPLLDVFLSLPSAPQIDITIG